MVWQESPCQERIEAHAEDISTLNFVSDCFDEDSSQIKDHERRSEVLGKGLVACRHLSVAACDMEEILFSVLMQR